MKWSEHVYKNKKEIWQVRHITDIYTCVDRSVDQSSPWHNFKQYFFYIAVTIYAIQIFVLLYFQKKLIWYKRLYLCLLLPFMEPVKKIQRDKRKGKTGKETGNKGGGRKKTMNITLLPPLEDYSCVCVCVWFVNCWSHPSEACFLVWVLSLILQVQRTFLIFLLPENPQTTRHNSL